LPGSIHLKKIYGYSFSEYFIIVRFESQGLLEFKVDFKGPSQLDAFVFPAGFRIQA
jgi:hypothetical protein